MAVRRARSCPRIPSWLIERIARDPVGVGSMRCCALVQIPGLVAVQVNDSPSMSCVTVQVVVGSRGCLMRWRAPSRRAPGSRRRIDLTDGVHKGQRSTLDITAHTRSAGASMSMVALAFMVAALGGWLVLKLGRRWLVRMLSPRCC